MSENMKIFKRIKKHFQLRKQIQHEELETLITICLYLHFEHGSRNPYRNHMWGHASCLKDLSNELRKQIEEKHVEQPEILQKNFCVHHEKGNGSNAKMVFVDEETHKKMHGFS